MNVRIHKTLGLRTSDPDYSSSWHVAGDPTMLIVLRGSVTIELRDGSTREFSSGDIFIAEDFLDEKVSFNPKIHGHKAFVSGDEELRVLHLKLRSRSEV